MFKPPGKAVLYSAVKLRSPGVIVELAGEWFPRRADRMARALRVRDRAFRVGNSLKLRVNRLEGDNCARRSLQSGLSALQRASVLIARLLRGADG
jgi:hypothetical protein